MNHIYIYTHKHTHKSHKYFINDKVQSSYIQFTLEEIE
jgi:hypothetical protein